MKKLKERASTLTNGHTVAQQKLRDEDITVTIIEAQAMR